MATGNLILGLGRGSIGDVTLYRSQGQQRARARNRKPKNPKTTSQTAQRIIMRTAVRAYSVLQEICNHSFEGLSYGAECMNRFNSLNADMLRKLALNEQNNVQDAYYGDFADISAPGITLNPFIVSKGTLPAISLKDFTGDSTVAVIDLQTAPKTLSYADVVAALGLEQGDQITVIQVNQFHALGRIKSVEWGRFILSPKSGDMTKLVSDIKEFNEKNVGNVAFTMGENGLSVNVGSAADKMFACAVIVSRKGATTWLRSDAALKLATDEAGTPMSEALAGDVAETLGESPYYLNQANRTTQEGGGENP